MATRLDRGFRGAFNTTDDRPGAHMTMAGDDAGSCRQCPVACERVVYPSGCIAANCSRMYSYEESGRTWFGCVAGIHGAEIDLAGFEAMQARRGGFGALRAIREPLSVCRSDVERTFEHRAQGPCVNPDFLLSAPRRPYRVTVAPRAGDRGGEP